jgi:type II secretory pathway pseudopilin PulG
MRKCFYNNDGMSLVTVMMVVGIMGIIAVTVSQMMINNKKESVVLENQIDKLALNRYLMAAASCSLTKDAAPSPCNDGTYVDVKPSKGTSTLVAKYLPNDPSKATKIGKWTVRAKCGPGKTLIFEARLAATSETTNPFKNISPDVPFGCVMP